MGHLAGLNDLRFPKRDASLSACIRNLSEPETGAPAENLVSNEDSYTRAVPELARSAPPGGVLLGVGPEQNFSLIAASRPGAAVIVDFRRRNALLHFLHKALFALAPSRADYLARLMARSPANVPKGDASPGSLVDAFSLAALDRRRLDGEIREVRRYLQPLGLVAEGEWAGLATIQAKLAGPGMGARFLGLPGYPTVGRMIRATDREGKPSHFLATEGSYLAVRELQRADRIAPIVGDFAGAGAMTRLAIGMREFGLALSVVYVSDVEFFLLRADTFNAYVANLAAMPRLDGSRIVRTSTRPIRHRERFKGDQCTTIVRDLAGFLDDARAGKVRSADDLFGD